MVQRGLGLVLIGLLLSACHSTPYGLKQLAPEGRLISWSLQVNGVAKILCARWATLQNQGTTCWKATKEDLEQFEIKPAPPVGDSHDPPLPLPGGDFLLKRGTLLTERGNDE